MSPLLIGLAALVLVCFAVLIAASMRRESNAAKLLASLAALPLLGFFGFGFLASLEGSGGPFLLFRVIYVVLLCLVAAALVATWWPRGSSV